MSLKDLLQRRRIEKKLDPGLASLATPAVHKTAEPTPAPSEPGLEVLADDIAIEAENIALEIADAIDDVIAYNASDPVFNRYHDLVVSSYFDPMELIEDPDTGPLIDLPHTEIRSLERSLFHNSADPFAAALNMLYQLWFMVRSLEYLYKDLIRSSIAANQLFSRKRDAKDARNLMLRHQQKLRRIKEAMSGLKLSSKVDTEEYPGILSSILLERENVNRFVEPSEIFKILKMLFEYLMLTNMEHWERCQDILTTHFGGLPMQSLNLQISESQPMFVSAGVRHILPLFDKHKSNSSIAGFSNAVEQSIREFTKDMESSLINSDSDELVEVIAASFLTLIRKEEVQQYIASIEALKNSMKPLEDSSQVAAGASAIRAAFNDLQYAVKVPWKTPTNIQIKENSKNTSSNNTTQRPVKQNNDKSTESGSQVSKNP